MIRRLCNVFRPQGTVMRRGAAFGFFRADVGPEHPLHGQDILFGRLAAQASRGKPLHSLADRANLTGLVLGDFTIL